MFDLATVREGLGSNKAVKLFDDAINPLEDRVEVFFRPHDTHCVIGLQDRVMFVRWPAGALKWVVPLVVPFGAAVAGAMAVGQKSGLGLMVVPYEKCSDVVVQRAGPTWIMEVVVPELGRAKISALYRVSTRPNHWNVFNWLPKRHEENMVQVERLQQLIAASSRPLAPAVQPVDISVQLERLAQLHGSGALTDAEFAAAKNALLY